MIGKLGSIGAFGKYCSKPVESYKLIADYIFNKSNFDIDRDKVYNKLNPSEFIQLNNFAFSLNSGYGLYKENYNNFRQISGTTGVFSNTDHNIHITNVKTVAIPVTEIPYKAGEVSPEYQIKVTGLLEGQWCSIGYFYNYPGDAKPPVQENTIKIIKDGIYTIPSFTFPSDIKAGTSTRIVFNFAGDTDITIEQIPEYPNHLVFDGIDDITSPIPNFNSKKGTILIQYNPITTEGINFGAIEENGLNQYISSFLISGRSLQSRGETLENYVSLDITVDNNISAFAYNDNGIELFNNGIFKNTTNINKHSSYVFGKDNNANFYKKLALKRIKIFDNKLTQKQLTEEYNLLLKEI